MKRRMARSVMDLGTKLKFQFVLFLEKYRINMVRSYSSWMKKHHKSTRKLIKDYFTPIILWSFFLTSIKNLKITIKSDESLFLKYLTIIIEVILMIKSTGTTKALQVSYRFEDCRIESDPRKKKLGLTIQKKLVQEPTLNSYIWIMCWPVKILRPT